MRIDGIKNAKRKRKTLPQALGKHPHRPGRERCLPEFPEFAERIERVWLSHCELRLSSPRPLPRLSFLLRKRCLEQNITWVPTAAPIANGDGSYCSLI